MIEAIIWALFLLSTTHAVFCLTRIDIRNLQFIDGLLIGLVYYITVPMLFILCHGKISPQFILADSYNPYVDISTTLLLIFGSYTICILHNIYSILWHPIHNDTTDSGPGMMAVMMMIFVITTVSSFLMTSIANGGHWFHSTEELLSSSTTGLVSKYASNYARTAIFGVFLFGYIRRSISRRTALLLGATVVLLDLFLSFNRITVVYYIVFALLIFRNSKLIFLGICFSVVFMIPFISNLWPMARGLATQSGYSWDGLLSAIRISYDYSLRNPIPFVDQINGVFESIDIVALKYIVDHLGATIPVLWGTTYWGRPLTIFLPGGLWPDRPGVFGGMLGMTINRDGHLALASTLFGEVYANFAYFWPLAFIINTSIYEMIFRRLSYRMPVFGFVGCFVAIATWRFDSSFGAVSVIMSIALLVLHRMSRRPPIIMTDLHSG